MHSLLRHVDGKFQAQARCSEHLTPSGHSMLIRAWQKAGWCPAAFDMMILRKMLMILRSMLILRRMLILQRMLHLAKDADPAKNAAFQLGTRSLVSG